MPSKLSRRLGFELARTVARLSAAENSMVSTIMDHTCPLFLQDTVPSTPHTVLNALAKARERFIPQVFDTLLQGDSVAEPHVVAMHLLAFLPSCAEGVLATALAALGDSSVVAQGKFCTDVGTNESCHTVFAHHSQIALFQQWLDAHAGLRSPDADAMTLGEVNAARSAWMTTLKGVEDTGCLSVVDPGWDAEVDQLQSPAGQDTPWNQFQLALRTIVTILPESVLPGSAATLLRKLISPTFPVDNYGCRETYELALAKVVEAVPAQKGEDLINGIVRFVEMDKAGDKTQGAYTQACHVACCIHDCMADAWNKRVFLELVYKDRVDKDGVVPDDVYAADLDATRAALESFGSLLVAGGSDIRIRYSVAAGVVKVLFLSQDAGALEMWEQLGEWEGGVLESRALRRRGSIHIPWV